MNAERMIKPHAVNQFDYIRLTVCDIHGIARSRIYPAKQWESIRKDGVYMYDGVLAMMPSGQALAHPDMCTKHGNSKAIPRTDKIHKVTWASTGHKVCEVFCDMYRLPSMALHEVCPMGAARTQITRLGELGLQLKGTFECEFMLFRDDEDSLAPSKMSMLSFAREEKFFYTLCDALGEAGVEVESMYTEVGKGMFEFTFTPTLGIQSADCIFLFRQAIAEISKREGVHCSVLSEIPTSTQANTLHFNMSLLNVDGHNILAEEKGLYKLSQIAQWWMGGLIKHGRGSAALMLPTVNCYRKLGKAFEPNLINWGVESRTTGFRIRNDDTNNISMEVRIPGGCANPYLVMAATVAAGIDGIQNKCPLPQEMDTKSELFPRSLQEALSELRQDKCMVECFGELFIDWYCRVKEREIEMIAEAKNGSNDNQDDIDLEIDLYKHIYIS